MALKIDTEARIERVRLENQASSLASPAAGYSQIYAMTTGSMRGLYIEYAGGQYDPLISAYPFDGRLTVSGSNPVPNIDISAAGKLFYTPYVGNRLTLLDANGSPEVHTFNELEWSVSTSGTSTYDAFVYDNAGTLTLEIVGWTSPTVRATAIVRENGILVKSGAITRSYLGTFYSKVANQINDTEVLRGSWNYYNRIWRTFYVTDITSHTYDSATWRQWRATASNKFELVIGVQEDAVNLNLKVQIKADADGRFANAGIGYDVTNALLTSPDTELISLNNQNVEFGGSFHHLAGVGYHYYAAIERAAAANQCTFVKSRFSGGILA